MVGRRPLVGVGHTRATAVRPHPRTTPTQPRPQSYQLLTTPPYLHSPLAPQYLAFVSSDSLPPDFKAALAVDIGLAALLGDGVYGFAQLLMHPIVKSLQGGSYAWLGEMLDVFNRWAPPHTHVQLNARAACACLQPPAATGVQPHPGKARPPPPPLCVQGRPARLRRAVRQVRDDAQLAAGAGGERAEAAGEGAKDPAPPGGGGRLAAARQGSSIPGCGSTHTHTHTHTHRAAAQTPARVFPPCRAASR